MGIYAEKYMFSNPYIGQKWILLVKNFAIDTFGPQM